MKSPTWALVLGLGALAGQAVAGGAGSGHLLLGPGAPSTPGTSSTCSEVCLPVPCDAGLTPSRWPESCGGSRSAPCFGHEVCFEGCQFGADRSAYFAEYEESDFACHVDFEGDEYEGPSHCEEAGRRRLASGVKPGALPRRAEVDLVAAEAGPAATDIGAVCGP
jgi:hypothetical protein